MRTLALAACLIGATSNANELPDEVGRLVKAAEIWAAVRYEHPWLLYKDIDWDRALVDQVEAIQDARSYRELATSIQAMLAVIGDPVTRVERKGNATEKSVWAEGSELLEWPADDLMVVRLGPAVSATDPLIVHEQIRALPEALAKVSKVVFDLRITDEDDVEWIHHLMSEINGLSKATVSGPEIRRVLHSGYRPQIRYSSGGYFTGFLTTPGSFLEGSKDAPERIAFVLNRRTQIPEVAMALRSSGRAVFVSDQPLDETSLIQHQTIEIGGGWHALIRLNESPVEHLARADAVADTRLDPDAPVFKAIELLQAPAQRAQGSVTPLPSPRWKLDATYADMAYPPLGYRVLAAVRLWAVIDRFYPYKDLIGDWDGVFTEYLPRFLAAANATEYATAVRHMATHIEDGHTRVTGGPTSGLVGPAELRVEVRLIEGRFTITAVDASLEPELAAGDVITAVDGQSVEQVIADKLPLAPGSTTLYRRLRALRLALRGPVDGRIGLTVENASGVRELTLPLSPMGTRRWRPTPGREPWKRFTRTIGYVDLTQLTVDQVDAVFEELGDTEGLIFDMRGYPKSTGWAIAPRLSKAERPETALFSRPLHLADGKSSPTEWTFTQHLPATDKPRYHGRTVMLIDERAASQSEHTGLFFEAANGTRFIGTETAGANGDISNLTLPGAILVWFSGHEVRHADGRQLQRVGLQPHVRVAPTIAGIRAGRDEVLERAIEVLSNEADE